MGLDAYVPVITMFYFIAADLLEQTHRIRSVIVDALVFDNESALYIYI
jgi:hypothetical protein